MQNKVAMRMVAGIVAIIALMAGYYAFNNFAKDPDLGNFESEGMIAAIEYSREGGRVILLDSNGKKTEAPEPEKKQYDDREVSWSADGQRVFVSSTRESNAYNVYRWNPVRELVERRATGSRSQTAPEFSDYLAGKNDKLGLILSGGYVFELDIRTGKTRQVLPPVTKERMAGDVGEGIGSPLEAMYRPFGDSFRRALWGKDKSVVWAVMRNDIGEVVIVQPIGFDPETGMPLAPREIVRGKKVGLQVLPDGRAVALVSGFQFGDPNTIPPEYIKDGRPVPPISCGIMVASVNDQAIPSMNPIVVLPPESPETFDEIAVSPDGKQVAVVVGQKDEKGVHTTQGMVVMALQQGSPPMVLAQGSVSQPSWSPDGKRLVYIKTQGDNTDIFIVNADGSGERQLTKGGKYAFPKFSPQMADK
ncbi:LpqB family beta-propeller domain-containing protein [Kamptonema cortianum]|nr:LpqB family beta-propeller domain-containing protein [Geitlerinema splendidum]MDK3162144.1 LpqB family beta-propeller domain-containing protein [Kamptonema cortianum]